MAQRVVGSTDKTESVETTKKENKSIAASPPMFKNKFLDSLTRVSPKEVFIIYIPTGNRPLIHSFSDALIHALTCHIYKLNHKSVHSNYSITPYIL
jgi:hypothetical protein